MTELTEKVLDLLRENGFEKDKALEALTSIYSEVEYSIWENVRLSPGVFYGVKDIVWYNLEHLPNGGEEKGASNLRLLGTVLPNFIYSFNDADYINKTEVPAFLREVDFILSKWDKSWRLANLYTNLPIGWQGGTNPSKIIIHERTESPKKYMPGEQTSRTSRILGPTGDRLNIQKNNEYQVFCSLDDEIGEYGQGPIFYGVLMQLREAARKAIEYDKDLRLIFDN